MEEWIWEFCFRKWDFLYLSNHSEFSIELINMYRRNMWDWSAFFPICFMEYRKIFMYRKTREHQMAFRIQKWWLQIYYSHHTKVGKRVINKKYDSLYNI